MDSGSGKRCSMDSCVGWIGRPRREMCRPAHLRVDARVDPKLREPVTAAAATTTTARGDRRRRAVLALRRERV